MPSTLLWAAVLISVAPEVSDKSATDDYEPPPGRLSFVQGEVFMRGPYDRDSWPATENTLVREADLVATGPQARGALGLGPSSKVSATASPRRDPAQT